MIAANIDNKWFAQKANVIVIELTRLSTVKIICLFVYLSIWLIFFSVTSDNIKENWRERLARFSEII